MAINAFDRARRADVGVLVIRIVFGLGITLHGFGKIQHPFTWLGPESPFPGILQALAALSEFGGGLALAFGFLTPVAAIGLATTLTVGLVTVHLRAGHPFVARGGGPSYELAALYLAFSFLVLLGGPGRLSVDALLFQRKPGTAPSPGPISELAEHREELA